MTNIKVITKQGKYPGKKVVILAGVHGNEVCGVKAFNELIPQINPKRGKITFIYSNLEAQKQNKRFVEANLNRCFLDEQPDEMKNTFEGQTAREIIPFLNEAEVLLDLHSSKSSDNLNYLICEENCLDLALALPPKKMITGIDKVEKGGTDGYMANKGKPGICIECGLHESDKSFEIAKIAILNLLKKTGNIEGNWQIYPNEEVFQTISLYKNKNGEFKLARQFKDFEEINERTLVGLDGDEETFIEAGNTMMFPNENKEIGKECFMVIRKKTE